MHKIRKKLLAYRIKGFTLLESLLTLFVVSFLTLTLSGGINSTFTSVKEALFWLQFESLYRDTQKLSLVSQTPMTLSLGQSISNGKTSLVLPDRIELLSRHNIHFDKSGGNSSLATIRFQTAQKTVSYQLYLGSGNYKKSETRRLHSP